MCVCPYYPTPAYGFLVSALIWLVLLLSHSICGGAAAVVVVAVRSLSGDDGGGAGDDDDYGVLLQVPTGD